MQEITKEQIEQWKAQHGSVYELKLESGEVCYVRSPKTSEIEAGQKLLAEQRFLSFNAFLFKNAFLGGADVMNDEVKLRSASSKMMEIVESVSVNVEKL